MVIDTVEHLALEPTDEERRRMRLRPLGRAVMRQAWLDLVFLHFPAEPEEAQGLLPPGLDIDTFPDKAGRPMAWVGLVAFHIEGIRPPWGPPLPYLSSFAEVNVRTYAHREGKEPAVWFCSLDGGSPPVRSIARAWYKVPYQRARVSFSTKEQGCVGYTCVRPSGVGCTVGGAAAEGTGRTAEPGSLEEFLFERYMLYSSSGGNLYSARVAHAPYRIRPLDVVRSESTLCAAAGVEERPWHCAHYCARIEAEFFAPRRIELARRT